VNKKIIKQSIIFNFYYFKLTTTNMEVHSKYASFQYETNNLLLNKCLKILNSYFYDDNSALT